MANNKKQEYNNGFSDGYEVAEDVLGDIHSGSFETNLQDLFGEVTDPQTYNTLDRSIQQTLSADEWQHWQLGFIAGCVQGAVERARFDR